MPRRGYKPTIYECALLLLECLRQQGNVEANKALVLIPEDFLRDLWNRSQLRAGLIENVADYLVEWNWSFFWTPMGYVALHNKTLENRRPLNKRLAREIREEVMKRDNPFGALEDELEKYYEENWA